MYICTQKKKKKRNCFDLLVTENTKTISIKIKYFQCLLDWVHVWNFESNFLNFIALLPLLPQFNQIWFQLMSPNKEDQNNLPEGRITFCKNILISLLSLSFWWHQPYWPLRFSRSLIEVSAIVPWRSCSAPVCKASNTPAYLELQGS